MKILLISTKTTRPGCHFKLYGCQKDQLCSLIVNYILVSGYLTYNNISLFQTLYWNVYSLIKDYGS